MKNFNTKKLKKRKNKLKNQFDLVEVLLKLKNLRSKMEIENYTLVVWQIKELDQLIIQLQEVREQTLKFLNILSLQSLQLELKCLKGEKQLRFRIFLYNLRSLVRGKINLNLKRKLLFVSILRISLKLKAIWNKYRKI